MHVPNSFLLVVLMPIWHCGLEKPAYIYPPVCDRFIIFTDIFSIPSRSQHVCILYHHMCHSCFVHKQLAYFVSFSTNMNFTCIQQISHVSKLVSLRGMPVPHKCKIMVSCRTQIAYIVSIVSRSQHVYISFMFFT